MTNILINLAGCTTSGFESPLNGAYERVVNKTDEDVFNLPIQLYQYAPETCTVTLTVNGTAQQESYGLGSNYTLSTTSCIIPAGNISPVVPVTITIINNPVINLDLSIEISLSNNKGYAFAYSNFNITIVDDARSGILDVPSPLGDGLNDTSAIQEIIDSAHALDDNYVIRFQKGTYLVDNQFAGCVYLYTGNTYTAALLGDTCIKRIDSSPVPSSGERLFTNSAWLPRDNEYTLAISNLIFDGNNQKTDEQSALIFIGQSSVAGEQSNFAIQDVIFQSNPAGDGLHIWTNVNAKVYRCDSYGTFRGSWTLTGGNTTVYIKDFITHTGDNDIEVDAYGYDGSYKLELTAVDCPMANLNDVGMGSGSDSVLSFTRCNSRALYNYQWLPGSTLSFNDTDFNMIYNYNNRMHSPYNTTFTSCNFIRSNGGTADLYPVIFPLVYSQWGTTYVPPWSSAVRTGDCIAWTDCVFKTDGNAFNYPERVTVFTCAFPVYSTPNNFWSSETVIAVNEYRKPVVSNTFRYKCTPVHAAVASTATNNFPGPYAYTCNEIVQAVFGSNWDGGNIYLTGTDSLGANQTETIIAVAGTTVSSTKTWGSITSISKETVGVATASNTVYIKLATYTTAVNEPEWPTIAGGTVLDGNITWLRDYELSEVFGDDRTNARKFVWNNCTFGDASTKDVVTVVRLTSNYFMRGGWFEFHNCSFNLNDAGDYWPIMLSGDDLAAHFYLELDNVTWNCNRFIYINGNYAGNIIKITDVALTKAQNVVSGNYYNITFDGDNTILRTITGTGVPGSMPGFCNVGATKYDQYHDTDSGLYYKCTSMNPVVWTEYTP